MKNVLALVCVSLLAACSESYQLPQADGAIEPMGDAGAPVLADAAPVGDTGSEEQPDAAAPPVDAPRVEEGVCEPDRSETAVSHNDCLRYEGRPICDAISERCVARPDSLCGACRTDDQCADVDLQARCVFMPGDAPSNNDSACLSPCETDDDCGWVAGAYGWAAPASCADFPAGRFCAPTWGSRHHCRDATGARMGL